jgi:type IV pilus assembly protein PilV
MLKSNMGECYKFHPPHFSASQRTQKGSMLLEALISILIFSMGILAIVGMQGAAVSFTTDAKYRTDASFIANQAIGEMWGDRQNLSTKAAALTGSIATLPGGQRTIVVLGNQATVTVRWQLPGQSTPHSYIAIAQING